MLAGADLDTFHSSQPQGLIRQGAGAEPRSHRRREERCRDVVPMRSWVRKRRTPRSTAAGASLITAGTSAATSKRLGAGCERCEVACSALGAKAEISPPAR